MPPQSLRPLPLVADAVASTRALVRLLLALAVVTATTWGGVLVFFAVVSRFFL